MLPVTVPTVFPGGLPPMLPPWLEFVLDGDFRRPGEPIGFAWKLHLLNERWVHVDLQIDLIVGAQELPVWNAVNLAWPQHVVTPLDTDGIWPPVGYIAGDLHAVGQGRTNLYSGLGDKLLRLRVTGHRPDGIQRSLEAEATLTVVAPAAPCTVAVTGPRNATINSPYLVQGRVATNAYCRMSADITVTGSDGAAFAPVRVDLPAGGTVSTVLTPPILQTWTWFDQPTYHVQSANLTRRFTYSPRATAITDEFGNTYPDAAGTAGTVVVSVGSNKVFAANEVEQDYWTNVGLIACGIIGGVLGVFTAGGGAVLGAGCAGSAVLVSADSAQWSAVANDPPEPDLDYWSAVRLPDSFQLPSDDDHAALLQFLNARLQLGQLITAASITTGKVLGARLDGALAAYERQLALLNQHVGAIHTTVQQLAEVADAALEVVRNDANLQPDKVNEFWAELVKSGPTDEQAKAITAVIGDTDIKTFLATVTDPKQLADRPSVLDAVSGMAAVTVRAVGAWLDDLLQHVGADQIPIDTRAVMTSASVRRLD
jgi:hypothetical protein